MTKRFQIANITSESINENEVGLCQYHYRVSCHSISMSNINCQMSQHINVKSISMSNVKCHVSNIKYRMSNQLILEISVDLMGLLDCLAHFQGLPSWPKLTLPPGPHVLLNPRDETCSVLVYWRTSLHMNKINYNHIQTSEINDSPRSLSLNRV